MKQSKSGREKSQSPASKNTSAIYKVVPTPNFLKEANKLRQKYPNIGKDFIALAKKLNKDPFTGNDYIFNDLWKVRMAITDKNQGESGGARVIIEVKVIEEQVFVLSVYDKSVREDLTDSEFRRLAKLSRPIPKEKTRPKGKPPRKRPPRRY